MTNTLKLMQEQLREYIRKQIFTSPGIAVGGCIGMILTRDVVSDIETKPDAELNGMEDEKTNGT